MLQKLFDLSGGCCNIPTVIALYHLYSRGLKSEQFSWMWTNRLRKSRHDRVTAGSQQSIKTQGDCLHLKDTKYHYNKHERAHPSHCRLLLCQHCFALQTIILPQWFDLRRSKTEWTKETMKREEVTVCEKERKEDKKKEQTKNTNENKCWKYNRTTPRTTPERPPERPLIHELSSAGPSLTTTWSAELPAPPHPFFIPNHQIKKTNVPPIQKRYVRGSNSKQQASSSRQAAASKQQPAFAPLKEWTNISFKNQRGTKNWTFSRRTALKQWNRSITKSCDDAKL